jgi:predicted hotdog family 3-hydroxylacyl-ACP dehydratase
VLPGVAQLALVEAALSRQAGREVRLAALRGVRFRRTVGPGEELDVRLAAGDDDEVRFELQLGEERVSDGAARVEGIGETAAAAALDGRPAPRSSPEEFPAVEKLIPHRGPALLLRRLLARDGDGLAALAAVPHDSPFVHRDRAPALLAVEMAAQTAAALAALGGEGPPRLGYLVGVREAVFPCAWLAAEAHYAVTVHPTGGARSLAVYDWRVEAGGVLHAGGTLSAFLT